MSAYRRMNPEIAYVSFWKRLYSLDEKACNVCAEEVVLLL